MIRNKRCFLLNVSDIGLEKIDDAIGQEFEQIDDSVDDVLTQALFVKTKSEKALREKKFHDPFETIEQARRDQKISDLLSIYVDSYKDKMKQSRRSRCILLIVSLFIVIGFSIILGALALVICISPKDLNVSDIVAFVTSCVSFISLIIGLLTIITKYFFPENDEKHITAIVQSIQNNDLENKRASASHQKSKDNTE